jgi:hypothetical protein
MEIFAGNFDEIARHFETVGVLKALPMQFSNNGIRRMPDCHLSCVRAGFWKL